MRERKRGLQLRVIAGSGCGGDGAQSGARVLPTAQSEASASTATMVADSPLHIGADGHSRRLPDADEAPRRRYYEQQHEQRRIGHNVDRLRHAIVDLAAIDLPPARLLQELSPDFDHPVIRERLLPAIDCLSRFAEAWCREEVGRTAAPQRRHEDSDDSR